MGLRGESHAGGRQVGWVLAGEAAGVDGKGLLEGRTASLELVGGLPSAILRTAFCLSSSLSLRVSFSLGRKTWSWPTLPWMTRTGMQSLQKVLVERKAGPCPSSSPASKSRWVPMEVACFEACSVFPTFRSEARCLPETRCTTNGEVGWNLDPGRRITKQSVKSWKE